MRPMRTKVSHEREVAKYFKEKAAQYDDVDTQAYWRLSDTLLWDLIGRVVERDLPQGFCFLDAGGGTGRWTERLLLAFPGASGVTFDMSADMLEVAARKKRKFPVSMQDRWETKLGDLHELDMPRRFNLVLCTHNVLGFALEAKLVLARLIAATKPGGVFILVVPNAYHGIYFNVSQFDLHEADRIAEDDLGKFVPGMPDIDFFRPQRLRALLTELQAVDVVVSGFPMFIYPGHQETQLHGQTKSLAERLEDPVTFDALLDLERKFLYDEAAAARGNNLCFVGHVGGAGE